MTSKTVNLKLFNGYSEWATIENFKLFEPNNWIGFLKNWKGLEPFCNVVMTIPFGIFLHYYFRKKFITTAVFSFCLSLFFELSQLTALFGIYPRPYRLFDVNDLFNNTLGGVIGWIITPLLCWFLPSRQAIDDDAYDHSENVSFPRRAVALAIDRLSFSFLFSMVMLLVETKYEFYLEILASIIFFTAVTYITNGYTIGKKLVKIKLENSNNNGRLGLFRLLIRESIIHGLFLGFIWAPDMFVFDYTNQYLSMAVWWCAFAILGVLAVDIIIHFSENKRVLIYEKLTGIKNIEI